MATAQRDYYEVLGVTRDADAKAIKDAFRTLALKYHPDRNKEPGAEERFKEIAEAYAVLSDPGKRAEYDAGGFARVAGLSPEDIFGGIDFEDLFGGLGFEFGGDSLFERLFGSRRRPAGPPRGESLEILLEVPLERVLKGGSETVTVRRPERCAACGGSGAKAGTVPRQCDRCGGSGQQVTRRGGPGISVQQITTCPACRGTGSFIDEPCPECAGRGRVERAERVKVKLPPGIEDGVALRVAGRGLESPVHGGQSGDLFVVVRSAPHPDFTRDGADLWRQETISVVDAVLGTRLRVPTLERHATVRIPPGTQPGTVLVLRGSGLPRFGSDRRGDINIRVEVSVPERLSDEKRELYERLRVLDHPQEPRRSASPDVTRSPA